MPGNTGRTGIHFIGHLFESDFSWLFRKQPINDYGIDANIELFDDNSDYPTGQLIALQIKRYVINLRKGVDN